MSNQNQTILEIWKDAFSAYSGAFDTPVARRKHDDEYAHDARDRMHKFNQAMLTLLSRHPQAAPEDDDQKDAARYRAIRNSATYGGRLSLYWSIPAIRNPSSFWGHTAFDQSIDMHFGLIPKPEPTVIK